MKKRIAITVPVAILLLALYFIIFGLSAQDGGESGALSQMLSEKCVDLFDSLSGRHWNPSEKLNLTVLFEHPIRKLAHFSEYAFMGVLVFVLLSQWVKETTKTGLLTVLWVLISAACDEFHQYFVPGRYASITDILLDTCGGLAGMFFCLAVDRILHKIRIRRNQIEKTHR